MIRTNPTKLRLLESLIAMVSLLVAPTAFAQAVAPLIPFENGEVANANDVNQNFNALRAAANQNGQSIQTLNGRLLAAEGVASQNESAIQQLAFPFSDSTNVTVQQQCIFGGGPVDGICVPTAEVESGSGPIGGAIQSVTIPLTELASLSLDAPGPGSLSVDLAVVAEFLCDYDGYCDNGGALFAAWVTTEDAPFTTTADVLSSCYSYNGGTDCFQSVEPPAGAIASTEIREPLFGFGVGFASEPLRFSSFGRIDVTEAGPIDLNLVVSCPRPVSSGAGSSYDETCVVDPDRTVIRATFFPEAD